MIRTKENITLLLVIIVIFFYMQDCAADPWDAERLIGKKAPFFMLKTIDGRSLTIDDFRGKLVILNFWATWCPPCKEELLNFIKLKETLKNPDLAILCVSVDGSLDKIKRYVRKYKIDLPILHDPNRDVSKRYGVFVIPTTFLINKQGVVINMFPGNRNWTSSRFNEEISRYLSSY